jgi:hypothetical protein
MPPFKLRYKCLNCRSKYTTWSVRLTYLAGMHSKLHGHDVEIFYPDGRKHSTIKAPSPTENW